MWLGVTAHWHTANAITKLTSRQATGKVIVTIEKQG